MSIADDPVALQKRVAELEEECSHLRGRIEQVEKDRIQYLQNVAHQLTAPLNAIKWHIENLTSARIGVERAQKVLRSIYSQATLAVHLAKNFSLMSNLEEDHALSKLKEPLEEVQLCVLLINLADDFQPLAWDKNVNIAVEVEGFETAPSMLAMRPLISQAFSNIIENAVKYSHDDSSIDIAGAYLPEKDLLVVEIRNRGIPITDDFQSLIFERGVRSPQAVAKYPAGTGFGLYIAKKIVEIHEGSILAGMDKGWTVFKLILPRRALEGKVRTRGG